MASKKHTSNEICAKILYWKCRNMKDIKDDLNKWKAISCLWIESSNNVNVSIKHQLKYRFNALPIKSQHFVFFFF